MARTITMIAARVLLAASVVSVVGIMLIYCATNPETLVWLNRPLSPLR